MRISIVGPVYPYRGGIAHFTTQLVLRLLSDGDDVQVISFRRLYPAWLYPGASDKDPSARPAQIPAEYILDPLYPWTWQAAARKIVSWGGELVVLHWWTTFWAIPFACVASSLKRKGMRVVYLIHNVFPHEQRFFDPWLARLALRRASAYMVQTERERERLQALLPGAQAVVCPHPAYDMFSAGRISKAEARQCLGLPLEQPVLLFFGIVRPYKGLNILFEALQRLHAWELRPRLLVAGEIWENRAGYQEQVKALGLVDQVRLEDRYVTDEEAAVMFSAADALVAPYVAGTQSGAASMAMGLGLPVIATDIVAAGIDKEYKQGVIVASAGDPADLCRALRQYLENPEGIKPAAVSADANWQRMGQMLKTLAGGENR